MARRKGMQSSRNNTPNSTDTRTHTLSTEQRLAGRATLYVRRGRRQRAAPTPSTIVSSRSPNTTQSTHDADVAIGETNTKKDNDKDEPRHRGAPRLVRSTVAIAGFPFEYLRVQVKRINGDNNTDDEGVFAEAAVRNAIDNSLRDAFGVVGGQGHRVDVIRLDARTGDAVLRVDGGASTVIRAALALAAQTESASMHVSVCQTSAYACFLRHCSRQWRPPRPQKSQ